MKFEEWEPIYRFILEDMKFDRLYDDRAAFFLSNILKKKALKKMPDVLDIAVLEKTIKGKDILVCGKAPNLSEEIKIVDFKRFVTVAADGATSVLMSAGIVPDIIVTDLDGNMDDEIRSNQLGSIMVVHAHGNNVNEVGAYVPKLKKVVGTTQSKPLWNVHNFGGFTDGDRCVFLAIEMGAGSITLIGFDFEDENVTPMKKKKLVWAKKLIDMVMGEGLFE
ncbi:MAG: 6-hydroxymethylpterin diphosphokinase MptE-like protein [Candidatus Methanoperedens sp.]|nr:6-hydroxymethylpterin diphosphokinase MptE-like protein [Candidatus Methanoperedens sp.]